MVTDWLARRAALSPDRIALTDATRSTSATAAGEKISYRAWNATANRTARFLQSLGVKRGDRVAVLAMNAVEVLDVWFSCAKLGAIFQPLNWRLGVGELAALVRDGAPVVLVYGPDFAPQADALRAEPSSVRHFVALVVDEARHAPAGVVAFDERAACSDAPLPSMSLGASDPWALCYTGGTTGIPKAAVLTYGSIHANALNTIVSWGLDGNDVALLNAPLFHTGGMNVFTAPLVMAGGASVVCRGFDVDQVFDLVRARAISVLFGVPTMFIAMQAHPRWSDIDFSSLKLVISGGAPCPTPVFEKFWERGVDFKTGYGLTEAGPNNFWLPPEEVRRRPGAVGVPLFDVEVKLVDHDGHTLDGAAEGELLIAGPHVCGGYWNRPEETGKTIQDGWLHTGDLARRDADGFFSIVGRSKDLIISGGENVYPAEVEAILAGHASVAEVALIGVPDAKWGEVPRAVVVLKPGTAVEERELITFAKSKLASYKTPKSVVFVEVMPKTAVGKIDKRALAAAHGKP